MMRMLIICGYFSLVPPANHRRPLRKRRRPYGFQRHVLETPDAIPADGPAFIEATRQFSGLAVDVQQARANRRGFPVGRNLDYGLNRLVNVRSVASGFVESIAAGAHEVLHGVIDDA